MNEQLKPPARPNDPWPIERIKALNARQVVHPMADPKAVLADPPLIIERGQGVYVYDIDGKRYLDSVAALWNVNAGHGRAEIKRAITEQLDKIAYYSIFVNTASPPSIELSARLIEMFAPEGMCRVLYGSGGSDATETAFKIARQYWKLEGQPDRSKVISLKYGYHGVHFGGTSANGNPGHRAPYEPLMPGFLQLESPYLYRNPWTSDPEELGRICAELLDREIQYQGARTVAAFIAEPVQGAGGMIVPPCNYWPLVRQVCDKHGVLLIADEVVTGFGRTGTICGARTWNTKPDIMCFAKGINSGYVPLSATLLSERVAAAWDRHDPMAAVMHGYTYAGHALACAAANANLQIVTDEDLPGNAARQGAALLAAMMPFGEKFRSVGDVRGLGLMVCLELVKDKKTKEPYGPADALPKRIVSIARRLGLIVRAQVNKLILSPPLVISRAEIDELASILGAAFAEAEAAEPR